MAKLHFRYGSMGSCKTAEALMLAYNFKERGRTPLLAKPEADTRTEKIWSRIGIESECITLEELCELDYSEIMKYDCVVIDEAQFATVDQIEFLSKIADIVDIPVFAYGLRTGYTGELFEGSKRLFELADELEPMRTSCWCGKTAIMNALLDENGNIEKNPGLQTKEALKGEFVSLCRKHWMEERLRP